MIRAATAAALLLAAPWVRAEGPGGREVRARVGADPVALRHDPDESAPRRGADGAAIRWIDDDLPRALAEGRARQVPVVVEVWAPW